MEELNTLNAISPIDGRYFLKVREASSYFSEMAFFKYRVIVEIEYLIALSQKAKIIRKFKSSQLLLLKKIISDFSYKDAQNIKEIEGEVKHDVKAVEYFLKENLKRSSLKDVLEMVHFALTSDDINNLALGLAVRNYLNKVTVIKLNKLVQTFKDLAKNYANIPMLARSHGQPAVPTTLGKEIAVFYNRIKRELDILEKLKISGKLNGAVGNFNAHYFVFPNIDWLVFSKSFINELGLEPDLVTTQIESYDSYIRIFDSLKRINTILIGFCQDFWRYISDDYLTQKAINQEVGSSTMPQKINPIFLENAEGNLGLANSMFKYYSDKLLISRLQRDLSDSCVRRTFGETLSLCSLSYDYISEGLGRLDVNKQKMREDLLNHFEIISEGIQTILRVNGYTKPYEQLKELTRGKKVDQDLIKGFVNNLKIPQEVKQKLENLSPLNYLGLSEKIVKTL